MASSASKPTYGRVSRYGLVAFGSSLDQIGPLAKDVTDAAITLGAIAGPDPNDSTTLPWTVPDYLAALMAMSKACGSGFRESISSRGSNPLVKQAIESAIQQIGRLDTSVDDLSLSYTKYALPAYYVVAPAEASSNLARYDGVKYGCRASGRTTGRCSRRPAKRRLARKVKRRIMIRNVHPVVRDTTRPITCKRRKCGR